MLHKNLGIIIMIMVILMQIVMLHFQLEQFKKKKKLVKLVLD